MPIAQSRMLDLIRIADTFKGQTLTTQRLISETIRALSPRPSTDELLAAIQTIQHINNAVHFAPSDLETLATERAHFRLNKSRNTRLAAKARLKRGAPLESAGTTAPPTIGTPPNPNAPLRGVAARFALLPDSDLAPHIDLPLAERKIAINAAHSTHNMPLPYPDPYDGAPLAPEHGGPTPDDSPIF